MPDFKKLKQHIDNLSKLLDDPQIGISSWHIMICEEWQQIAKMWSLINEYNFINIPKDYLLTE